MRLELDDTFIRRTNLALMRTTFVSGSHSV